MRAVTYDDFVRLVSAFLYSEWEPAAGLSREMIEGFLAHGIPEEWARVISKGTQGAIPVSFWPRLIPSPKSLSRHGTKGTLGTPNMEAQTASRGAKVSQARVKGDWPFYRALHKRRLALSEWARAQKRPAVSVESAKSWMKRPGKGGRPTPQVWADAIAAEFKDENGESEVPAVAESWPNGIR